MSEADFLEVPSTSQNFKMKRVRSRQRMVTCTLRVYCMLMGRENSLRVSSGGGGGGGGGQGGFRPPHSESLGDIYIFLLIQKLNPN